MTLMPDWTADRPTASLWSPQRLMSNPHNTPNQPEGLILFMLKQQMHGAFLCCELGSISPALLAPAAGYPVSRDSTDIKL